MLRMLKVCDKRRPNLYEQGLELWVLRIRNQCFVERVEHRLMIRHLVTDIGFVELCAFECFQPSKRVLAGAFQTLACVVLFRLYVQLGHERSSLLVDTAMIGHHAFSEGL